MLEPLERLGVPPKSSAEIIRHHPFFSGGKASVHEDEDGSPKPWSIVDWNTLWTLPAPEIQVGPYRSKPKDSSTADLWQGFESLEVAND